MGHATARWRLLWGPYWYPSARVPPWLHDSRVPRRRAVLDASATSAQGRYLRHHMRRLEWRRVTAAADLLRNQDVAVTEQLPCVFDVDDAFSARSHQARAALIHCPRCLSVTLQRSA
jgi:hypothetical protein